jgi:hypothetical protein
MNKNEMHDAIENFINYYTSDEETAVRMFETLKDYMDEVYQEPQEVMVFTFDEQIGGNRYLKKAVGDASPTREFIPEEELHLWVKKYLDAGWDVKVQGEVN